MEKPRSYVFEEGGKGLATLTMATLTMATLTMATLTMGPRSLWPRSLYCTYFTVRTGYAYQPPYCTYCTYGLRVPTSVPA